MSMSSLSELFGWLIVVYASYRLLDYLIHYPYVLGRLQRYIFITGCDTGFGHLLAKDLDLEGCNVFAGCFTEQGEEILKEQCSYRLKTVRLNVSDQESLKKAYKFVQDNLPDDKGLWGLVNNAGIAGKVGPVDWLETSDYMDCFNVNLFGLINTTKTFLPLIKKEKGRIVNAASITGRIALPGCAPYSLSKYGVEAFSDILRREMFDYGCTVHILEPGFHKTYITDTNMLIRHVDGLWNRLSPELKEEYGEEYLESVKKVGIEEMIQFFSSSKVQDVVDAYKHALFAKFPRARYGIGWDAKLIWLPLSVLPEWLSDFVLRCNSNRPIPNILKEKK